ncbi:hypothetical protein C8J57DRAFT_1556610 [Mycena rebaudengoi]|nr:hypothetical protein C8J57DRAFT_1556610 [Mycena rebaudengoi]
MADMENVSVGCLIVIYHEALRQDVGGVHFGSDMGLVASWRSDIDGILIFAGLFSASPTAFLIESYKTLSPDSGEASVLLLERILQQLAAQANSTIFSIHSFQPFTPSTSVTLSGSSVSGSA